MWTTRTHQFCEKRYADARFLFLFLENQQKVKENNHHNADAVAADALQIPMLKKEVERKRETINETVL